MPFSTLAVIEVAIVLIAVIGTAVTVFGSWDADRVPARRVIVIEAVILWVVASLLNTQLGMDLGSLAVFVAACVRASASMLSRHQLLATDS